MTNVKIYVKCQMLDRHPGPCAYGVLLLHEQSGKTLTASGTSDSADYSMFQIETAGIMHGLSLLKTKDVEITVVSGLAGLAGLKSRFKNMGFIWMGRDDEDEHMRACRRIAEMTLNDRYGR